MQAQSTKIGKKKISMQEETKRAGLVILMSDKIDFKPKIVTKDKEGQYIMIKGSICQENTKYVHICT